MRQSVTDQAPVRLRGWCLRLTVAAEVVPDAEAAQERQHVLEHQREVGRVVGQREGDDDD